MCIVFLRFTGADHKILVIAAIMISTPVGSAMLDRPFFARISPLNHSLHILTLFRKCLPSRFLHIITFVLFDKKFLMSVLILGYSKVNTESSNKTVSYRADDFLFLPVASRTGPLLVSVGEEHLFLRLQFATLHYRARFVPILILNNAILSTLIFLSITGSSAV